MDYSDDLLRSIFKETKIIACVGMSPKERRASHSVSKYLISQGYRVIPINPVHAGEEILGELVYARLSDIPSDICIDMIDIFRRSEQVLPVVEEALEVLPNLRTVWMQLEITNAEATAMAAARGISVIQNRCPAIDLPRLLAS